MTIDNLNIELILSIYASVIATLVFLWKIYAYINDRRGRLGITQRKMNRYYFDGYQTGPGEEIFEVIIVNKGSSTRYIERPLFKINKTTSSGDKFSAFTREDISITYPRPIQPGEKISYSVPLEGLKEKMQNATKVKSLVFDTHGKKFKSKWLAL